MSVLVLYSTFSKLSVFSILKGSTGADHHMSNLNGFVTSSGLLRSASMELSPSKAVSTGTFFFNKNIKTYCIFPAPQKSTLGGLAGVALSRGQDIPGH
jgi:hypothetical protein